uniref:DNA replication complex GINS protein PSF2 n=1 Tax=Blastobotrys adeninivorans TaxID=409370 RepID=A0A060SYP3_BLAAD
MATTRPQNTFLPSELMFLAEDTLVTVIPRQAMDPVELIGMRTPKLSAMKRINLPLWMALVLKKQSRVNIVPPDWLEEESLQKSYEIEKREQAFAPMPWHWLEISQALLNGAADDFQSSPATIRALLRDIREARQAKIRNGLEQLNESFMRMDNLGVMEVNEVRPLITKVMDELRKVNTAANPDPMDQME